MHAGTIGPLAYYINATCFFMGNSKRRKANIHQPAKANFSQGRGERLMSNLQDPRLSGVGAGAMFVGAISVEISGSAGVAAIFFSIAWLFVAWISYEKGWFELRKRLTIVFILALVGVVFSVIWWSLIPAHPPSAQEIAAEIYKANRLSSTSTPQLPIAAAPSPSLNATPSQPPNVATFVPTPHARGDDEMARRNQQVNTYANRALALYEADNLDQALVWCDKALAIDPKNNRALKLKTRIQKTKKILPPRP